MRLSTVVPLAAALLVACASVNTVALPDLFREGHAHAGKRVRLSGTVSRLGEEEMTVKHRRTAGYARAATLETVPYAVLTMEGTTGEAVCYFEGQARPAVARGEIATLVGRVDESTPASSRKVLLHDCEVEETW